MNRLSFILPIAVAMLVLMACSQDDNPASAAGATQLVPLEVGNEWVFECQHSFNGQIDTTHITKIHLYRSKTDSTGAMVYSMLDSDTLKLNGKAIESWWKNSPLGFEMYTNVAGNFVYRYPVNAGYSYILDIELMYYKVIVSNTDTLITVPAGSFRCYKYDLYTKKDERFATDYMCPGVGWVLRRNGFDVGNYFIEERLVSYTLH